MVAWLLRVLPVDCACALAGYCCGGVVVGGSYLWTAHAHWQAAAVVVCGGSYLWTAHAHWQAAAVVVC